MEGRRGRRRQAGAPPGPGSMVDVILETDDDAGAPASSWPTDRGQGDRSWLHPGGSPPRTEPLQAAPPEARGGDGRPRVPRALVGQAAAPAPSDPSDDAVLIEPHPPVDGVEPAAPQPAAATGATGAARRGRRRAAVAAAVVAAVLVVGANVVESRRLAAREATFAAMPATVGSLDQPLERVWEMSATAATSRAGDILLMREQDAGGLTRAVDVASGRERWSVPRSGPDGLDRCVGDRRGEATTVVVCWRGAEVAGAAAGRVRTAGALVALDAADGTVLAEHAMTLPTAGFGVLGDDVVVGHEGDDELTVERFSAATGAPVWTTTLDLEGRTLGGFTVADLSLEHGFVVVRGPTTAVLDAADGRALGRWRGGGFGEGGIQYAMDGAQVRTTSRGFAVLRRSVDAPAGTDGTWFGPTGEPAAEIEGTVVEPTTVDGSRPEVLLTSPDGAAVLVATDVAAGRELWRTDAPDGQVLLRRDGAVVLADDDGVRSIDLAEGTPRWSAAVPGLRPGGGMVTDGSTVAVPALRDGQWVLVALDLDDGVVRWEAPVPPGPVSSRGGRGALLVWVGEVGGSAVLTDGARITGLG